MRGPGARALGLLGTVAVLLLLLNFALPRAMPGDPLTALLAEGSTTSVGDPTQQQELRRFYQVDQPLEVQFRSYLEGLVRGDLGRSLRYRLPVAELLVERLPRTLLLVGTAMIIGTSVGVAVGAAAGWRRGSRLDATALAGVALLRGVPVFFLASLMCYVGAVRLGWFPLSGSGTRFADLDPVASVVDTARHLALPAAVLALYQAAAQLLLMRSGVVAQHGAGYLLTARAAGLAERTVRRHAGRNALLPVVGGLSVEVGAAVTGAVVVETVFAYDGVGSLLVDAIGSRDYPLLQGGFLVVTGIVLVASLLADLVTARIDPRTVAQ